MAQQTTQVESVISTLNEIQEDATVPRNVKAQVQGITETLRAETEFSIKINKALSALDGMSNDVNLQSYTRTQIWNIMSTLEKLH